MVELCPHPITEMLVSPVSRFLDGCSYFCDQSGDAVFIQHPGSIPEALMWIPSPAGRSQELVGC